MWEKSSQPPSPFGECTICRRHDCGEYTDKDGDKKQLWLYLPLEMFKGGNLHIGYQCIKSMSEDIGLTKSVVQVPIYLTPTAQQIHDYIMRGLRNVPEESSPADKPDFSSMGRDELKSWLKDKGVHFAPQMGEDKLRELAMQHG